MFADGLEEFDSAREVVTDLIEEYKVIWILYTLVSSFLNLFLCSFFIYNYYFKAAERLDYVNWKGPSSGVDTSQQLSSINDISDDERVKR